MFGTLGCLLVEASDIAGTPGLASAKAQTFPSHAKSGAAGRVARPLAVRSLAGKPVIDWVLGRASEAVQLDAICVVSPKSVSLGELRDSLPSGIMLFESDEPDSLARICDCLRTHPAEGIVNLRLDSPLLDPCLIDRLVTSVQTGHGVEYATFHSRQSKAEGRLLSLVHARLGLFAEYIQADVLRRLDRELTAAADRQRFAQFICAHPEKFSLRLVSLPAELDRDDLRFSLRHQDDWDHAEQIVEAIGDDDLDWQHIVALLGSQPHLRRRMADLNRAELAAVKS